MTVLGRRKLHDEKSRGYEYPHQIVYPRSVRHAMNAPNVDQFYTNGCVGFSGTNLLNCSAAQKSRRQFHWIDRVKRSTRYLTNDDGLTNYGNATANDPFDWRYPPTDDGASALGLMKWWLAAGIITMYEWCFTMNQFLAALQHQPVLVGTNWYDGMMAPDRLGRIKPTGTSVGGHEYLADQIIWKTKYIGFENSWGENWGLGGRFYMSFGDVEALLKDGGDVAVPKLL